MTETAATSLTNIPEQILDKEEVAEIPAPPQSPETFVTNVSNNLPVVEVVAPVASPILPPAAPQVIIPPPNPDYIRIQDDPDDENLVIAPTTEVIAPVVEPLAITAEASEEEVETEKEPSRRPRRGKKEALRKAPARRRTKKDLEKEAEVLAPNSDTVAPLTINTSFERITDEDLTAPTTVSSEAIIEAVSSTVVVLENTTESSSESSSESSESQPEVWIGSLQISNDSSLERVVDAENLSDTQETLAEETTDSDLSPDRENDGGEEEKVTSPYSKSNTQLDSRKTPFSARRGGRRRGRRSNTYHSGYNRGQGEESLPPEKLGEPREVVNNNLINNIARQPGISELLREGQEILVQIAKEPIALKGARITSHIALPGRYLVYMPTVNHIGVSRKIPSDTERLRLKRLITALRDREKPPGGFIVRTACENRSEEELHEDMLYLARTWQEIKRKVERTKAPALICRELDLVERTLRDQLSTDITAIRVDNEFEYTRVIDFVNRFQPKLVNRVKLYTRKRPIFEECGVQDDLDKAIRPRVWLNSGGYIVINQTEALVAIDVNTGKFVGRSNRLEDTITKTNLEAVREIVRQIRLRDLGGIIILDFIDMEERKNRLRVMQALEAELKADRAPSKVLQFNDFGLVAITRKRVRQSLERTLCSPCPYCHGAGLVKSPQTVCYEILAEARRVSTEMEITPGMDIILRVHPSIAEAMRTSEKKVLNEIEAHLGIPITVKGDLAVHQERYDFAIL
jgi:ribonuclease G